MKIVEDTREKALTRARDLWSMQKDVHCGRCFAFIPRGKNPKTLPYQHSHVVVCPACVRSARADKRRRQFTLAGISVEEDALESAKQCIEDAVDVYSRGGSMIILDEAMRSLKYDALPRIKAALELFEDQRAERGEGIIHTAIEAEDANE